MDSNLFGSWVAGGNPRKEGGRKKDDFYPTPRECVLALLEHGDVPDTVWEPACGNGAIARVLEEGGRAVYSTDLNDYGYGDAGQDFLLAQYAPVNAVITNPPFILLPTLSGSALT